MTITAKNIQVIKYIYELQPTDIVDVEIPGFKAISNKTISFFASCKSTY